MMKKTLCALALAAVSFGAQASIVEGFENVANLASKGFVIRNDSTPVGGLPYQQGGLGFDAQAGTAQSYFGFNYNAGVAGGTLSDWLITPLFPTFTSGTISFYVQGATDGSYFDQFQFGMSEGGTAASDFMLSNVITATQGVWTKFTLDFVGTGVTGSAGRFGIRYTGSADNANGLGIDSLSYVPEPTSTLLIGLGLAGLVAARRRRSA